MRYIDGSGTELSGVDIDKLHAFPQWLPYLAKWHHEEWLIGELLSPIESTVDINTADEDLAAREQRLQSHLEAIDFPCTFVAHSNNEPIGSVSIVTYSFSQQSASSQWLSNMYVLPHFRKQGIAELLMHKALRYARHHDLVELKLFTRDQADYYVKRGWQRIDRARLQRRDVDILSFNVRDVR